MERDPPHHTAPKPGQTNTSPHPPAFSGLTISGLALASSGLAFPGPALAFSGLAQRAAFS